ncbi:arabinosyltransferase [Rhodococcoides fascians]|uniref:arabinosyltransferase domain-containing protein n=1 Tax=Rhodococcoides fascians TaxID=1828 RepID=UPI000B9B908B|nr:arabinosyltransferase domain-containing protein [Rhodococcus fascians]OZE88816.1 arabinosyltransferase [Rhodococcus fascians]OZF16777.1 arabinosyltransferase [Rhodococcus fascians]OZF19796.1 arabinosyltransferase [Rhodococcus fascians]OZF66060.1 arabinosyltransferase [Rhodococcus fascians]OZF69213.1 arabinosyltransferase [Rhodococcus fascians]
MARLVAIVSALVGILLTISIPLLPIEQQQSSLSWPQSDTVGNVEAPLVGYTPISVDTTVPCAAAADLSNGGLLLSTSPKGSPDAYRYGLVAEVTGGEASQLKVTLRDSVLLEKPVSELSPSTAGDCSLTITSNGTATTVGVTGDDTVSREGDVRPQLVGVFSDLQGNVPGLQLQAELDSRFSSTPSALKWFAMIVGVLATGISLVALHRLDLSDGRRARRFLPGRWWSFGPADAVVIGTLLVWHVIGANTSDDGYQLGMARTADHAGYMANYFRYFGVPETPFGTPLYDMFTLLSHVSTASVWMRIPTLICGVVVWLVLSREVIPRFGAAARASKTALWTGGLVMLAFWLPYNNGLRPEPFVALGVLLTWCSVERSIATRRLLPAAAAILIAALTVTCAPSGFICFAPLIAGARPVIQIVVARARAFGTRAWGALTLLAPLIASGTVVLVFAFGNQTVAGMLEMQRVHTAAGPSQAWFEEYLRYQWLMNMDIDGSLARRFGVFVMVVSLIAVVIAMLRKGGKIPGTATGPARRIVGITVGAMALMMITPTKWTHHFGVFAGLAASVAVLAAVATGAAVLRSRRNRLLFAAAVSFLTAVAFTGTNGYWYVSAWGVPFWDKPILVAGLGISTMFLGLTVLLLLAAVWFHLRAPYVRADKPMARWWSVPPIAVAAGLMVLLAVASMAKGAVAQWPSYSVAKSNLSALAGNTCGLANDVLLETNPNADVLQPISGDAVAALGAENDGFTPDGVARDLTADKESSASGTSNTVDTEDQQQPTSTTGAGTGGSALPYGLDPATVPVLGSFGSDTPATLTTGWYALPADPGQLVSIAAAGRIRSVNSDGIVTYGQNLELEYGVDGRAQGRVTPIDIGPTPSWRNLRVPMDLIPAGSNMIRLVLSDTDRDPDQWLAVTPPRVPRTQTLNEVVGRENPVLLDWEVGFNFPCQHPFDHRLGVAEVPQYRVLPDRSGAVITNAWQDHFGGGPLGWIDVVASARTIPSYLDGDWDRDWGSIEQYTQYDRSAEPAKITATEIQRSGLWTPGPIKTG